MASEIRVVIGSAIDIVTARQEGRRLALKLGFESGDATLIAASISEVARNIVNHARSGEIILDALQLGSRYGIQIVAQDEGPGIRDLAAAMQYGYSTGKGLGVGLPGAKWLMDEFEIDTEPGKGTNVKMIKWMR
jgi:serine/threonine-protein kinase RsbT